MALGETANTWEEHQWRPCNSGWCQAWAAHLNEWRMSLFLCQRSTVTPLHPSSSTRPLPTEGNSYSLAITEKMMCALKCALPA